MTATDSPSAISVFRLNDTGQELRSLATAMGTADGPLPIAEFGFSPQNTELPLFIDKIFAYSSLLRYRRDMTTTLFMNGRSQAVRLPKELRLPGKEVSIRRLGAGVLVEPITHTHWPHGYFESIRLTDPSFERPEQGVTPPVVNFDA
jgi:virulence-associated protein VagC